MKENKEKDEVCPKCGHWYIGEHKFDTSFKKCLMCNYEWRT